MKYPFISKNFEWKQQDEGPLKNFNEKNNVYPVEMVIALENVRFWPN